MRNFIKSFLRHSGLAPRHEFGGGGGGPTQSNKFTPPDYTVDAWKQYVNNGVGLADPKNFQPYGGQTVANLNPMTAGGLQQLNEFAMNGSPERSAGGAALLNADQANMNPYATALNPYMGQSPQFQSMLDNSNDLISKNFAKGTAAQTDASAAQQGAFGGSAYNEKQNDNSRTLAGAIAANTANLQNTQFDKSAALADSALNRATGAYDNTQNRALQGAQIGIGQQGADLQAILAAISGGQIPQQNQQQLLDAAKSYYQQGQQAPFSASDYLGNLLGRASGSYGTNTQVGPGQSTGMGLLGGGIGLASLFGLG